MSGCYTCGGFGNRHDPIAHDTEPEPCPCGGEFDVDEWVRCPACGCMCSPSAWSCWRCGEGLPDDEQARAER